MTPASSSCFTRRRQADGDRCTRCARSTLLKRPSRCSSSRMLRSMASSCSEGATVRMKKLEWNVPSHDIAPPRAPPGECACTLRGSVPRLRNKEKRMNQDLDAYWMPFTANRQFKKAPRMLARAEGMHFYTPEGRPVLDAIAGLWCVNAGHARPKIVQAIQQQAAELDYAPPFQMGHPKAFELAERLVELTPKGLSKVFFTNSGSESVDTALKMAIAYHRVRGEGQRTRLIGRERGYHGVNFGGISVGGMVANRKMFGTLLAGVDHIRHTHDPARNAFTVGQPAHGAEFADDLERLIAL